MALVASVFDAYSAVLFLPEQGSESAVLRAWFSMGDDIAPGIRIAPGRGLVGWILRNRSPLLVNAIEENQAYLGYYQQVMEPGIRAFMGSPIPGGGALCIDSTRSQAFAESRQKLLHLFARLVPQLNKCSEYNAREQEAFVYFQALERMTDIRTGYVGWDGYLKQLLPLLVKTTGFPYAAFAAKAEGSSHYTVEGEYPALLNQQGKLAELSVESGIIGWVFRNGEAVHNEGSNPSAATPVFGKTPLVPDFASAICVPVIVDKNICGVLCLADVEPRTFSSALRAFVRMAADDMARLLETVSLRYRIHRLMPRASVQRNGAVVFNPDSSGL